MISDCRLIDAVSQYSQFKAVFIQRWLAEDGKEANMYDNRPKGFYRMPSGGKRPGAGRRPVPEKRVRLQAYITPQALKILNNMSEDLDKPIGQIIEDMLIKESDG